MNIVFLGINSSYSHVPFSYSYLRGVALLKKIDGEWTLVEGTLKDDDQPILEKLALARPDLIVSTLYLFNHEKAVELLKQHRTMFPGTVIVLGGPEFLGDNQPFLRRNPEIDMVARGDESSFPRIIESISKPDSWSSIDGLCFISKDGVYHDGGMAELDMELDELPSPYSEPFFIRRDVPFYPLETSRGCGGKCSFCTSSLSQDVKFHSLERVFSDLKRLHQNGIREIRVLDRTFNENTERAVALIDGFVDDFADMRFHLEINPANVTDELYERFEKAPRGMFELELGLQTFSESANRATKRRGAGEKALGMTRRLAKLSNIKIHADLIGGLPEQTFDDVVSDTEKLVNSYVDEIQLELLKVLPGTPINVNSGLRWNDTSPYQVLNTNWMDEQSLSRVMDISRMLDAYHNPPKLNPAFIFAFHRQSNFIERFAARYASFAPSGAKPGLAERLRLLNDVMTGDDQALEMCRFCWLAIGLSPAEYGLKAVRNDDAVHVGKKTLWRSPQSKRNSPKRWVEASFSFNVGDFWLNPNSKFVPKKTIYLFMKEDASSVSSILLSGD